MRIKVRPLHLAAYIKTHGGVLLDIEDEQFVFESEKTTKQWRIEHSVSCCRKVDKELIDLRNLLKSK
jgi:hypothetical protein